MKIAVVLLVNLLLTTGTWAAAVVQSVSGEARVEKAGASIALEMQQTIASGNVVHTGADGRAVLRFDDGQMAVVGSGSSLRIDEHQFDATIPEKGSSRLSLLKGALRVVTGLIGHRNPESFILSTPNATIGVRGTDFMVAIANPVYLTVNQGAIVASNRAGSQIFEAGSLGVVTAPTRLARPIAATALPDRVNATFSTLRSVSGLSGGGGVGGPPGQITHDDRKSEAQTDQKKTDRNDDAEKDKRKGSVPQGERADLSRLRESTERSASGLKTEKVDRPEAAEKLEKVEKVEKVERVERVERVEKVEKIERPERVERVEKIEKLEKVERPEKSSRS